MFEKRTPNSDTIIHIAVCFSKIVSTSIKRVGAQLQETQRQKIIAIIRNVIMLQIRIKAKLL